MAEEIDELVITFKKPILNKAKDQITQIVLREPTAAEWRAWDKLEGVEADIQAVATVSGQPPFVIEQMVASQLVEGSRFIGGFLRAVPKIGAGE